MAQEWIRLLLNSKSLKIKVGLSPFFVDEFVPHVTLLQLYINHFVAVIFETSRSNLMMAAILNLLMLSDQEDGYLKNVHSLVDGQTVKKI